MEDTKDFQIWNQNDQCNLDFLIQPEDLPGPEAEPVISETVLHDIHCLSSAVSLKGIGCYQLFFDISGLKPSDWNYLTLYQMLLTELDTSHFTVEQQKNKEQELLYDCTFDELYPEREAGKNSHPMMSVFWYGLTEDLKKVWNCFWILWAAAIMRTVRPFYGSLTSICRIMTCPGLTMVHLWLTALQSGISGGTVASGIC